MYKEATVCIWVHDCRGISVSWIRELKLGLGRGSPPQQYSYFEHHSVFLGITMQLVTLGLGLEGFRGFRFRAWELLLRILR